MGAIKDRSIIIDDISKCYGIIIEAKISPLEGRENEACFETLINKALLMIFKTNFFILFWKVETI